MSRTSNLHTRVYTDLNIIIYVSSYTTITKMLCWSHFLDALNVIFVCFVFFIVMVKSKQWIGTCPNLWGTTGLKTCWDLNQLVDHLIFLLFKYLLIIFVCLYLRSGLNYYIGRCFCFKRIKWLLIAWRCHVTVPRIHYVTSCFEKSLVVLSLFKIESASKHTMKTSTKIVPTTFILILWVYYR